MKTIVIHHSADYDGIFCREIARKFLPDAELIGWDFANPPLPLPPKDAKVFVLDLPCDAPFGHKFPANPTHEQFGSALKMHPEFLNWTWIDHHKSAIESHPVDLPGYRIDGVAACRLAWQFFKHWVPDMNNGVGGINNFWEKPTKELFVERKVGEPLAVRLAGEYDIWDKRDPNADIFQFGLRSRDLSEHDWKMLLDPEPDKELAGTGMEIANSDLITRGLLEAGSILQGYQRQNDSNVVNYRSFIVQWEGMKFLALTTARCNSLTFEAKDVPETGHDALMAFYYNGRDWNFSLYHAKHRTDLDLSQIAVKHGGGGHRGACGFRSKTIPFQC